MINSHYALKLMSQAGLEDKLAPRDRSGAQACRLQVLVLWLDNRFTRFSITEFEAGRTRFKGT